MKKNAACARLEELLRENKDRIYSQRAKANCVKSPFPWFGSKSPVADVAWRAFGDAPNFVDPFGGSLGVLLNRPGEPRTETVNDLDALLVNFWRAARAAPEEVARHADYPVSEIDMNARHRAIVERARSGLRAEVEADPEHFDAKIAGWWLWGICQWIGPNWCEQAFKEKRSARAETRYSIARDASGSHAPTWGKFPKRLPHLGNAGMGVHAPTFGDARGALLAISARLRRVRITCGDWRRVLTPAVTTIHGVTAVFLDPPYPVSAEVDYPVGSAPGLWEEVARWAGENGKNPRLRIALCGYEGMPAPEGWAKHEWRTSGGYGARGEASPDRVSEGRKNAGRERVWFSPHCLSSGSQVSLF